MVSTRVCHNCSQLKPTPEMDMMYNEEGRFQFWECKKKCGEEDII